MNSNNNRRRSKGAVAYAFLGVVLILILLILGISIFMKVMVIDVSGSSSYSDDEVITASGISIGDNILFIDAGAAARRLRVAKPYISEAEIISELPDTIRIIVKESTAIAAVEYGNSVLLINSSGKVLSQTDVLQKDLIEIRGFVPAETEVGNRLRTVSESETQLVSMTDVLTAFEKAGITDKVSYLDVTYISNIKFGYSERFTVILGGSSNVNHKLNQLPVMIEDIDEKHSPDVSGEIDMSDTSGEWRFKQTT